MKNIHVLPTDKPSRLFINPLWENQLRFVKNQLIEKKHKERFPQHIYITSNEELVLSGYHFNSKYGDEPQKTNQRDIDSKKYWEEEDYYITKIILTTDQDLISDGVQAIDDEFLEWFVKNPSYEEVVVADLWREGNPSTHDSYQLVIPQEEPKEEQIKCYCGHTITCDCGPLEEPKQETLKEDEILQDEINYWYEKTGSLTSEEIVRRAYSLGIKSQQDTFQQERMYSEEEVYNLLETAMKDCYLWELEEHYSGNYKNLKKWFEQFKNKNYE